MKRKTFLASLLAIPAGIKAAMVMGENKESAIPYASFVGDVLDHPPAITNLEWKIVDLGPWGKCKFHYNKTLDSK